MTIIIPSLNSRYNISIQVELGVHFMQVNPIQLIWKTTINRLLTTELNDSPRDSEEEANVVLDNLRNIQLKTNFN